MAENEISLTHEISDCIIVKLSIKHFGKKANQLKELFPEAKLLVFCDDPWKIIGMNAVVLNENITYVLVK